jgi:putative Holliday junction resolvase
VNGRVVAFDLGDKRIGVAVSDPTGTIAEGRETLIRSGESLPWKAILALLEEWEAALVVVGDPLHLDGSAGERARLAREFAGEVSRRSGLPVDLQDERLTTVQAERALREGRGGGGGGGGEAGWRSGGGMEDARRARGGRERAGRGRIASKRRRTKTEDVDRIAAVLILQTWLDRRAAREDRQ